MALNTFGWDASSFTADHAGNTIPGVTLYVWADKARTIPVTALYADDGVTSLGGVVTSDADGWFGFKAPDTYAKLYVATNAPGSKAYALPALEGLTVNGSIVGKADKSYVDATFVTAATASSTYAASAEVPVAPAPTGSNDTTALQAFLTANAGKRVQLRLGASYSISGTLNVTSGADIDARGATITQTASATPIFTGTAVNGLTVRNGKFVGKTTDYADTTATYPACVVRATTGSKNIRLLDCDVRGFAGAAVYASGVTGLRVSGNTIVGVGNGGGAGTFAFTAGISKDNCGIIMDGTCAKVWIDKNEISYTAQGILGGINTDVIIDSNDIHDIGGQHGVYLNNTVRLKMTNNTVRNTAANGLKVQLSTFGNGDCTEVLIQGNFTIGTGGSGIHCTLSPSAGADRFKRIEILDNVLTNVGIADGIMLQNADGFRIQGNIVRTTQGSGIRSDDSINGSICDNLTRDTYDQGIRVNGSVTTSPVAGDGIRIARNRIMDPAVAASGTTNFGISTSGCGNLTFEDNWITDTGSKMRYGMYVAAGTQSTMDFAGNRVSGATDYGARLLTTSAARKWVDNDLSGGLGAVTGFPTSFPTRIGSRGQSNQYVASALPTSGLFRVGDEIINGAPAVGSAKAWMVTVTGGANAGTWAASTAYALGVWRRNSTGQVYEATVAGTSGTTGPVGTTVGGTETDGTVTWTCRATTAATLVSTGNL